MSIDTSKSSITKPCLHSDGRGLPVCWDCAEEGHIQGEGEATTSSTNPTWQRFKKIRGSPRFLDGNPHTSPSHNSPQSIAPEVHPAEEGIEVGSPDTRKSQPGLIVVEGPRVVSPEEKLWKSQPRRFSTEKEAIDSRPSRLLGLQKRSFQVAVAIAFLVVGAIVIGVAVGISHKGMGYTELSMSDGDQQPTSTTTAQGIATVSSASEPSNTSGITGSSSRNCIGADKSTYTDSSTGEKFRLECQTAHQGKDIENLEAYSMQACISLCADNDQCAGAIWYNVGPQGTDLNYCWLKSSMDDDLEETPDAQSVVKL